MNELGLLTEIKGILRSIDMSLIILSIVAILMLTCKNMGGK